MFKGHMTQKICMDDYIQMVTQEVFVPKNSATRLSYFQILLWMAGNIIYLTASAYMFLRGKVIYYKAFAWHFCLGLEWKASERFIQFHLSSSKHHTESEYIQINTPFTDNNM